MRRLTLLAAAAALGWSAAGLGQGTLLIGNKGEDSLSFVDLRTGRERRRVPTGRMPHEIALSPDGSQAAVVAYGGRTIELFDVATARRVRVVTLGENARPHGIAWLRDGRIVATTEGRDAVAVVDLRGTGEATVRSIPTGAKGSHMIAVTADGRRAYVANMGSGSVSEIDLVAMRKRRDIAVPGQPEGIAVTRDGRRLWVADRAGAMLYAVDTGTGRVSARVATGKTPIRVLLTPDERQVLTSNFASGTIDVFDATTNARIRTIPVGEAGSDQVTMLLSTDGARLYVAETGIDRIAEIDLASGSVLGRLPAGRNGDGLGISPASVRQ